MQTDADFKVADFATPALLELADALSVGLRRFYESVCVECVPCPDLTEFGAATAGLGGDTALLEFGGEPYAHNPAYRGTNASIDAMLEATGIAGARVFGAAMADAAATAGNCGELVTNVNPGVVNLSRVARVGAERQCIVEDYSAMTCGPIANLFVTDGAAGDVLYVDVSKRTGEEISLTQAMRNSLAEVPGGEQHIGLGGVFELVEGRVRSHVMPNYDCLVEGYYDVGKEQVVKDFLQFYEHMGPGLLLFTTLWTGDPTGGGLNLRPSGEHTHFYHRDGSTQQAGHYHGDVTPDQVRYRGYFNTAARILRVGDIYEKLGLQP